MTPIEGKNILVSILVEDEFIPVLCGTDMSFTCTQEVLLATTADTGLYRKKRLRGLSEWRVDVSGLTKIDNTDGQASFFYLLQENVRGTEQTIQIMFEDADDNTQVIEGPVLIPDISISGGMTGFADSSVSFEGSGAFEIGAVDSGVDSDICDQLDSDTWVMAEGETTISGLGQQGKSFEGREIVEVDVEGLQYDYTAGVPGNREYAYDGVEVSVESEAGPGGVKVFVLWK